jgi:hypothetical protein
MPLTEPRRSMIVVPTPDWIWIAVAVMVLCMIGYIVLGINASSV